MPATPHIEEHFTGGETVRDIVIGMSDGLTVPFALAAGLSGAVAGTMIVVTAGLAEVAAGSIAMGLGDYRAARSDAEHSTSELAREGLEIRIKGSILVTSQNLPQHSHFQSVTAVNPGSEHGREHVHEGKYAIS